MHGTNQDPLTLKLRATLFELRRKGLYNIKSSCGQGPLIGVTLMTKRYKSKRCMQALQSHKTPRDFDENEVKTYIFKRLANKSNKRSTGLEISKAVIHYNQYKKTRVSTQRSFDSNEENHLNTTTKDYLYKRLGKHRKVLATHRENEHEFRQSTTKNMNQSDDLWLPGSSYTQLIRCKRINRQKIKSVEMQVQKLESIEGWNVDNQEENDYP